MQRLKFKHLAHTYLMLLVSCLYSVHLYTNPVISNCTTLLYCYPPQATSLSRSLPQCTDGVIIRVDFYKITFTRQALLYYQTDQCHESGQYQLRYNSPSCLNYCQLPIISTSCGHSKIPQGGLGFCLVHTLFSKRSMNQMLLEILKHLWNTLPAL